MDVERTHHYDHPFAAVWAMVLDPDAHVAKYEHMGHRQVTLLKAGPIDGGLEIDIVRKVEVEVPGVAKRFISPTNTVNSQDRWTLEADGVGLGVSSVDIKGVPVTSVGRARIVPDADGSGCTSTITLSLEVKVPIVGDKVARAMRPQLEAQLDAEFAASEAWLASADR